MASALSRVSGLRPPPGPISSRVRRGSASSAQRIRRCRRPADDDPGQRRRRRPRTRLRRRHGDEAGADPGGGARGEPRRAGHHRAADHQRRGRACICGRRRRAGKFATRPDWFAGGRRAPSSTGGCRYARHDRAAQVAAGQQQVTRLRPEEGHCERRARSDAADLAARAVDPARHIDRDHRHPAGVNQR